METFTLTRKELSALLLSIGGAGGRAPQEILQEAWTKHHRKEVQKGTALPALLSTDIPPVLLKIIRGGAKRGLSLREIAALGQLIEYSSLSPSAMQNWVKRDFKEYLGSPRMGKKYSVNQAALLLIVEDLKAALDFESIRRLFRQLFLAPDTDEDDLIEPAELYYSYAELFENLRGEKLLQELAEGLPGSMPLAGGSPAVPRSERLVRRLERLTRKQRDAVANMLLIAAVCVQTACLQAAARQYANAALFLDF
ncbi:DUF1836 domain-containing protein [Paenibacillus sp. CN-4]|uniref:DUF1836 domain-containing protein n=1 Tax=Paenibacillus nanchangensis TaxID=3348343 RepID=UPI00397B5DDD